MLYEEIVRLSESGDYVLETVAEENGQQEASTVAEMPEGDS